MNEIKEIYLANNKYYEFQKNYIQKRSNEWPFLKLLQTPNTTINAIFNEILLNFDKQAEKEELNYQQYSEYLDEALGIFYNLNYWVKESLGKDEIDKYINEDNMEEYVDDYTNFWFHQEYTIEEYSSLTIQFPNNIDALLPDIISYLECRYLNSKIINWSLVDIIIFKELKAFSSDVHFQITQTNSSYSSSLFNRKRSKAIKESSKLESKLYNLYLQCNPFMFHPQVIKELCIDVRKEGDFYDGVLFEVLDTMIKSKQNNIYI